MTPSSRRPSPRRTARLIGAAAAVAVLAGPVSAPLASATPLASAAPRAATAAAIAAPTGLAGIPGDRSVTLSWTPTAGAVSYRVFRNYDLVGQPTSAGFTDTGLANGTSYSYYVRAVSSTGVISAQSTTVRVTPAAPSIAAPTGLAGTPGDRSVALSWTPTAGAVSYRLFRNATLVGQPTAAAFTDTGLANGTSYSYYVRAVSSAGVISAQSTSVTVTPVAPRIAAPAGLAGTPGDRSVALTWTPTTGAVSYRLFRNATLIAQPTAATFTDTGLANGTSYSYYVRAVTSSGTISDPSASVSVTPVGSLAAPVGLAAEAGNATVTLTWTASAGATSYTVLRDGAKVATSSTTAFTDTGLTNGRTYAYAVAAVGSAGTSTASTSVSVTPKAPAAATESPARLAWFYKPPTDEATVLREFDTFVLTKGDEAFVSKVRAAQPSAQILQYFMFTQIVKPDAGSVEWRNNAANQPGDFAWLMENRPSWFLRDTNGNPIKDTTGKFYWMDPGNEEWRSYWLSKFTASNTGWDGLFLDNVDLSLIALESEGRATSRDYATDAAYQDAIAGFLARIDREYSAKTGKPMSGNLVHGSSSRNGLPKYLPYLDGYMEEAFAADWHTGYLSASAWAAQLARVDSFVAKGGSALLVAQSDSQTDYARQRFTYASYLLVAGPTVSFRFTSSGSYRYPWMYDNYSALLGKPLGARTTLADGTVRRDFEGGYVTVNPSTRAASIVTR